VRSSALSISSCRKRSWSRQCACTEAASHPRRGRDADQLLLAVLDNEGDPDGNAAYGNSFCHHARFADASSSTTSTGRNKARRPPRGNSRHLQFHAELGQLRDKTRAHRSDRRGDLQERNRGRGCGAGCATSARRTSSRDGERVHRPAGKGGGSTPVKRTCEGVWQAVYDHTCRSTSTIPCARHHRRGRPRWRNRIDHATGFFRIAPSQPVARIRLRCGAPRRGSSRSCSTRDKRQGEDRHRSVGST